MPGWARASGEGAHRPRGRLELLRVSRRRPHGRAGARGARRPAPGLLSPRYPLLSELLDEAIHQLFLVENLEDRFAVCLFFLKDETLGYRQRDAMADLLGVVKRLMQPDRHMDAERILTRLTAFFRGRDNEFLLMRFQCYEAIGVAIGEAGNVKAADHLIEDILYWKFQYPDVSGSTDEWETVVNPYHLPKIRCWMHIIESNPALFERLAAALNVQLRLGGVYIADTDLFQRDVTRFLNADIRPIYFVAKQLLRTFPVYFSEVGAEGELRSVSTQIDEICARRDTLMHFVRKQVHAESSNRLVVFSRAVLSYWLTLDPEPRVVPLREHAARRARGGGLGPGAAPRAPRPPAAAPRGGGRPAAPRRRRGAGRPEGGRPTLSPDDAFIDELLALSPTSLRRGSRRCPRRMSVRPARTTRSPPALVRRQLASRRPARAHPPAARPQVLSHRRRRGRGGAPLSAAAPPRAPGVRARRGGLAGGPDAARTRDRLLDAALTVLEELKAIVLGAATSVATENIYQKRHIAAGIPSIYGTYAEAKFDALGLSFRVESLVGRLLDDLVAEGIEPYVTRDSLRRMAAAIRRLERALAVDGVDSRALSANLTMLENSFGLHNFTFRQYQNVFQFLANSVTELSSTSVLSHEQVLHTTLVHDPRQCEARGLSVDAAAEMVLREVLVSALGMQDLDRYVAAALRRISMLNGRLGSQALTRMMNYDPERLVSPLHKPQPETDDQMTLGFKGLGLKQMATYGHRVPEGFVLSIELFGAMPALSYQPLYDDTIQRVAEGARQVERQTRLRLGHPTRTLLLSIRSGAAISMPGLMTTFVNVGLNDEVTEALARQPGSRLGGVGQLPPLPAVVGHGRRHRPRLLRRHHERVQEPLRRAAQARLLGGADARDRLRLQGARPGGGRRVRGRPLRPGGVVHLQGARLVGLAARAPLPSVHRRRGGVGHGRGRPAHGVRQPQPRVRLGGHVHQQPAGALQPPGAPVRRLRRALSGRGPGRGAGLPAAHLGGAAAGQPHLPGLERSLERDYPQVYAQLLAVARDLVGEREFDPQEIEFTFESPAGEDLYVLQKRAVVQEQTKDAAYFDTSSPNFGPPVAVGMGVAGGAYSGRAAVNARQIDTLLAEEPGRRHHPAAPRHGAGGHRHDRPRQRHPHRPRGHDVARRGHGQAPGQDRGGRVPRPRGRRARRAPSAWPATSSTWATGCPSTGGPATSSSVASPPSHSLCSPTPL